MYVLKDNDYVLGQRNDSVVQEKVTLSSMGFMYRMELKFNLNQLSCTILPQSMNLDYFCISLQESFLETRIFVPHSKSYRYSEEPFLTSIGLSLCYI